MAADWQRYARKVPTTVAIPARRSHTQRPIFLEVHLHATGVPFWLPCTAWISYELPTKVRLGGTYGEIYRLSGGDLLGPIKEYTRTLVQGS